MPAVTVAVWYFYEIVFISENNKTPKSLFGKKEKEICAGTSEIIFFKGGILEGNLEKEENMRLKM